MRRKRVVGKQKGRKICEIVERCHGCCGIVNGNGMTVEKEID